MTIREEEIAAVALKMDSNYKRAAYLRDQGIPLAGAAHRIPDPSELPEGPLSDIDTLTPPRNNYFPPDERPPSGRARRGTGVQARPQFVSNEEDPMAPLRAHAQRNIDNDTISHEGGKPHTVFSGSVEDERLNGGKPTLIPFQWDGQIVDQEEATARAVESGEPWPAFETNKEADDASKALSDTIEVESDRPAVRIFNEGKEVIPGTDEPETTDPEDAFWASIPDPRSESTDPDDAFWDAIELPKGFVHGMPPTPLTASQDNRAFASLKSYGQGVFDPVAVWPKSIGLALADSSPEVMASFDAMDRGESLLQTYTDPLNIPSAVEREFEAASPERRLEMRHEFHERKAEAIMTSKFYSLGLGLEEIIKDLMPVDPEHQKEFWVGTVARGLGQATTIVAEFAATRRIPVRGAKWIAYGVGALQGAAMNAPSVFEDAIENGADVDVALEAAFYGGLLGLTEVLPIGALFKRADKASGGQITERLKDVATQGTEEAIQEAFVEIMNNLIGLGMYDPERKIFTGEVAEAGAGGFAIGSILEVIMGLAGGRRRRAMTQTDLDRKALALEEQDAVVEEELLAEAQAKGLDALDTEIHVTEGMLAVEEHRRAIDEAEVGLDAADAKSQVEIEIAAAFEEREAQEAKQLAGEITVAEEQREQQDREAAGASIQERLRGEMLQEDADAQQGERPINPVMARALLDAGVTPGVILEMHQEAQAALQAEMDADATPEADVAEVVEPVALLEDQRADFAVTPEGTAVPRSEQPARTGQEAAEPSITAERPFEATEVTEQRELGREVGEALATLEPPTQPIAPESLPPLPTESAEASEPVAWKHERGAKTYTDPEGRFTILNRARDWLVSTTKGVEDSPFIGQSAGKPKQPVNQRGFRTLAEAKAAVEEARAREAAAEAVAPEGASRKERNTITDPNTGKTFEGTTYYDAEGKSLGTVMDINEEAIRNNPALQPWSRPDAESVAAKADEAATSPTNDLAAPTDAQIEADNYKKGHLSPEDTGLPGIEISVENPASDTSRGGETHYGDILGTIGADGDRVDVQVNKDIDPTADTDVYVIDQINQETGQFDEHKSMVGYKSIVAARRAYAKSYEKGWKVGKVTIMSKTEFTDWVNDSEATQRPTNPNTPVGTETRLSVRGAENREAVTEGETQYESPEEIAARENDENMAELDEDLNTRRLATVKGKTDAASEEGANEARKQLNALAWRAGGRPVMHAIGDPETTALLEEVAADQGTSPDNVGAWFDTRTNTTHVVLRPGETVDSAVKRAIHEEIGHKGFHALFPNKKDRDAILDIIFKDANPEQIQRIIVAYPWLDVSKKSGRHMIAEEYIAHLAERTEGGEDAGLLDRVIASVRAALRKMGVDVGQWNDNDIKRLLRRGAGKLQRGKPMDHTLIKSEVEVTGTGEVVTIEERADIALRQTDKRMSVISMLRDCLSA